MSSQNGRRPLTQAEARRQAYQEALKKRQEHEAELTARAGTAALGAAKNKSKNWRKPTRNLTKRNIQAAYDHAATLGQLKPVKPSARRVDGSPLLKEGQVYVTKTGTKYHPAWCHFIAAKWDHDQRLLVIRLADVGLRTPCDACSTPLTSSRI